MPGGTRGKALESPEVNPEAATCSALPGRKVLGWRRIPAASVWCSRGTLPRSAPTETTSVWLGIGRRHPTGRNPEGALETKSRTTKRPAVNSRPSVTLSSVTRPRLNRGRFPPGGRAQKVPLTPIAYWTPNSSSRKPLAYRAEVLLYRSKVWGWFRILRALANTFRRRDHVYSKFTSML